MPGIQITLENKHGGDLIYHRFAGIGRTARRVQMAVRFRCAEALIPENGRDFQLSLYFFGKFPSGLSAGANIARHV